MFTVVKLNQLIYLIILLSSLNIYTQEKVIGIIENDADSKPIPNVHVINLNKVVLPEPDSPTIPRTSPVFIENEILLTTFILILLGSLKLLVIFLIVFLYVLE